ncbi:MAG: ribosome-associated translation inhibitor RaiA [Pseudomonadota bacterium]
MHIDIRAQGFPLTEALREHAGRRIAFALSRFHDRMERVAVRLADDNGPRGGVDKRCQVRVHLRGLPEVVITEMSEDIYAAIDRAADRAGRTLARRLARQREFAPGEAPDLAGEAREQPGETRP